MFNRYITNWIPTAEAQMIVLKHLADGTYKKGQIKLSSRRWADPNDHSKGYLARVYVIGGIHPELELGDTGRVKNTKPVEETKSTTVEAPQSELNETGMTMWYGTESNSTSATITVA